MSRIKIRKPGLLTTIQDAGRMGFRKFGVPASGVIDCYSHRLANLLVGNDEYESVLEITLSGPEIEFLDDTIIALTGGDLSPSLNDTFMSMWQSIFVRRGDILSFGKAKNGCRSYIAFAGSINIPIVMGSKSTYLRGRFGGYEGRALYSEDILNIINDKSTNKAILREIPKEFLPHFAEDINLRVVMGPQDSWFTESGLETFLSAQYEVTNECDRMGCRLKGKPIIHKSGADIVSDGIAFGAVQVPADGQPIIMLADSQTVGGYTKIANVISVDLPKIAQARPGNRINFHSISLEEAHGLLLQQEEQISHLKKILQRNETSTARRFNVKVSNKIYDVIVEEFSE